MAGEVPEPGSDALLQWARQASEEFGSNFRTQFYVSWIYEKAGLYKGNKTRRDVATAYNAIWQILEEQFPKRSTWPCWPEQRDLRHGDQHFQDLIHAKPLKKEIIEAMYSLASVEIAAKKGSQTDKPALFEKIYGSPPLQPDVTRVLKSLGQSGRNILLKATSLIYSNCSDRLPRTRHLGLLTHQKRIVSTDLNK